MSTALKRRRDWRPAFLEKLAEHGNITAAAKAAVVDRKTIYKHRANDPKFAEAWDDAIDTAIDRLEMELLKRAAVGEKRVRTETVTDADGKVVSTKRIEETVKSDTLLIFQLKALRPEKYRDNFNLGQMVAELAASRDQEPADEPPAGAEKAPRRGRRPRSGGGESAA